MSRGKRENGAGREVIAVRYAGARTGVVAGKWTDSVPIFGGLSVGEVQEECKRGLQEKLLEF